MIAGDREERNHRFLEEALELVQSLGCSASEAHQLVDYVYGRDVGDPPQEVGGVMVTLAALCLANDLDMHANGETELARIWTKVDAIRAKQAAKPKHSPLPEHVSTPTPVQEPAKGAVGAYERLERALDETFPYVGCRDDLREVAATNAGQTPSPANAVASVSDEQVEVGALRKALKTLLDACYRASGREELPWCIDGSMLDDAADALELQYPVIWTDEQVEALRQRQADASKHPYTCGNDRSDAAHTSLAEQECEEAGLLYPTPRGWRCPACDYRQFWSHETGEAAAIAATPSPANDVASDGQLEAVKAIEEALAFLGTARQAIPNTSAARSKLGTALAALSTKP